MSGPATKFTDPYFLWPISIHVVSNKSVLLLLVATVKVESKQWPGTVKVAVRGGLKRSVWAMLTL